METKEAWLGFVSGLFMRLWDYIFQRRGVTLTVRISVHRRKGAIWPWECFQVAVSGVGEIKTEMKGTVRFCEKWTCFHYFINSKWFAAKVNGNAILRTISGMLQNKKMVQISFKVLLMWNRLHTWTAHLFRSPGSFHFRAKCESIMERCAPVLLGSLTDRDCA